MRDSLLLIAAACLAFGLSLGGVFHFDDYALFNDAGITSPLATRPLTNFTFWVNEQLGGHNPTGYHALNLALHLATVLLLHGALRRILPAGAALAAALLFAVHPIQTEAVNYVFARGTLLAALCCAGSLRAWLHERRWIAVIWFAAALLAKEECVAFPLCLLLLELSRARGRAVLAPVGAMLLLAAAAGIRVLAASASIQHSGAGVNARFRATEYLSIQGVVILSYLGHVLLPWGFSIDPQIPQPAWWLRLGAWLLVAALAGAALRWFSRARAGLWFVGGLLLLLPSSSIFPANDLAADRRMYLPMLAFSPALGWLLMKLDRKGLAALLLVLAGISVRYTYIWNSEQRLWAEAAARAPGKVRPLIQLARASDSPHDALVVLAQAENKAPADPDVASEQGRMYLTLGKPADALAAFGRALALAPGDPAALNNRGVALLALGQAAAARQDFERALAGNPCLFDPRLNLKRLGAAPPPAHQCRYTPEQQQALLP